MQPECGRPARSRRPHNIPVRWACRGTWSLNGEASLRAFLKTRPVRAPDLQAWGGSAQSCRPRALTRRSPQSFQTRSQACPLFPASVRRERAGRPRADGMASVEMLWCGNQWPPSAVEVWFHGPKREPPDAN